MKRITPEEAAAKIEEGYKDLLEQRAIKGEHEEP
jgi:hypothetical protein